MSCFGLTFASTCGTAFTRCCFGCNSSTLLDCSHTVKASGWFALNRTMCNILTHVKKNRVTVRLKYLYNHLWGSVYMCLRGGNLATFIRTHTPKLFLTNSQTSSRRPASSTKYTHRYICLPVCIQVDIYNTQNTHARPRTHSRSQSLSEFIW